MRSIPWRSLPTGGSYLFPRVRWVAWRRTLPDRPRHVLCNESSLSGTGVSGPYGTQRDKPIPSRLCFVLARKENIRRGTRRRRTSPIRRREERRLPEVICWDCKKTGLLRPACLQCSSSVVLAIDPRRGRSSARPRKGSRRTTARRGL